MPNWEWKLRLFASADLVGSTAYKASQSISSPREWAKTFREFFHEFPTYLKTLYNALPTKLTPCSQFLTPWKYLGDEILFVAELQTYSEALSHITALKNAIETFPQTEWIPKSIPLSLKGAAWLAGFPVTNTEIFFPNDSQISIDFIGPSIDLGFRIAKFAEPRKLILSADLALILLDAIDELEVDKTGYRFGFSGREVLKGVVGNQPYPVLWLGIPDATFFLEEDLLRTPCDPTKLKEYLRKFIDHTPKLIRPFIAGDPNPKYSTIPPEMLSIRAEMQVEDSGRGYEDTNPDTV